MHRVLMMKMWNPEAAAGWARPKTKEKHNLISLSRVKEKSDYLCYSAKVLGKKAEEFGSLWNKLQLEILPSSLKNLCYKLLLIFPVDNERNILGRAYDQLWLLTGKLILDREIILYFTTSS